MDHLCVAGMPQKKTPAEAGVKILLSDFDILDCLAASREPKSDQAEAQKGKGGRLGHIHRRTVYRHMGKFVGRFGICDRPRSRRDAVNCKGEQVRVRLTSTKLEYEQMIVQAFDQDECAGGVETAFEIHEGIRTG